MLTPPTRPLAGLLLSLCLAPQDTTQDPTASPLRPNVLVIVMDDVSNREIDRVPTPRFDALAARGMRFNRAYAAPVCSPARRMLVFGEYWYRDSGTPCTGQNYKQAQPKLDALSLPRMFRTAGYRTALFGKWHLGSYDGVEEGEPWQLVAQKHGFETWRAGLSANIKSPCLKLATYTHWQRVDDGVDTVSDTYVTEAIGIESLAWLEQRAAEPEAPWFAMVCFQAAHGPFHVPPGMAEKGGVYSSRDRYELMIQNLDRAIGELLDAVDLEQTLVLLVGDNGTPHNVPFSKAEQDRGKTTTFEGGIQVPMVWAGPGVATGLESASLVSFVDVLPTLAELIGFESEALGSLDGMSLAQVLVDPTLPAHDFVWSGCAGPNVAPGGDFAVVTERWKLRLVKGKTKLYDLHSDPGETINLAPGEATTTPSDPSLGEGYHQELIDQLMPLLIETRPGKKRK